MTNLDALLIFWALPALLTLYACCCIVRYGDGLRLEDLDKDDVFVILIICALYPISWTGFTLKKVLPWLAKERSFPWFKHS